MQLFRSSIQVLDRWSFYSTNRKRRIHLYSANTHSTHKPKQIFFSLYRTCIWLQEKKPEVMTYATTTVLYDLHSFSCEISHKGRNSSNLSLTDTQAVCPLILWSHDYHQAVLGYHFPFLFLVNSIFGHMQCFFQPFHFQN